MTGNITYIIPNPDGNEGFRFGKMSDLGLTYAPVLLASDAVEQLFENGIESLLKRHIVVRHDASRQLLWWSPLQWWGWLCDEIVSIRTATFTDGKVRIAHESAAFELSAAEFLQNSVIQRLIQSHYIFDDKAMALQRKDPDWEYHDYRGGEHVLVFFGAASRPF